MRIAVIDTESTGVNPSTARIIEIGLAIYDVPRRAVLELYSTLCELPPKVELPPQITTLTGITQADLDEFGVPLPDALLQVATICALHRVERLAGHNARGFDAPLISAEVTRLAALREEIIAFAKLPLIDTLEDLPLPDSTTSRRLGHLVADHGIAPCPWGHRALLDALWSLRLLECYPIDEVIRRADSPTTVMQALVSFDTNHLAKSLGFGWEPAPAKRWVKRVKRCDEERLLARAKEIGLELRSVA